MVRMKNEREINKKGDVFSTLRPFKLMLSSECDDSINLKGLSVLKTSPFLFISRSFFIRTISIQFIYLYVYIYIYTFLLNSPPNAYTFL